MMSRASNLRDNWGDFLFETEIETVQASFGSLENNAQILFGGNRVDGGVFVRPKRSPQNLFFSCFAQQVMFRAACSHTCLVF